MAQPGHTQGHDWQHKSLILPDRVREKRRERDRCPWEEIKYDLSTLSADIRDTIRVLHSHTYTMRYHVQRAIFNLWHEGKKIKQGRYSI